jgi:hypothetical protein
MKEEDKDEKDIFKDSACVLWLGRHFPVPASICSFLVASCGLQAHVKMVRARSGISFRHHRGWVLEGSTSTSFESGGQLLLFASLEFAVAFSGELGR